MIHDKRLRYMFKPKGIYQSIPPTFTQRQRILNNQHEIFTNSKPQ